MDSLRFTKKPGLTFAPEAGSERLRQIINKSISDDEILDTVANALGKGWTNFKLYFMVGLPTESIEDIEGIVHLVSQMRRLKNGGQPRIKLSISTFVPKSHTPFQWVPCDTIEQINAKQDLLKRTLRGKGLKLNWHSPEDTMLEAWLSRGDRRMADVVYNAWQRGAKFDAWKEHFSYERWVEAFQEIGLDPDFYTHRERPIDETFPWEHINTTVRKKFLAEDYLWSTQGRTRVDCRERCFACGILPKFVETRKQTDPEAWKCPPVTPSSERGKNRQALPPSS